MQHKLLKTSHIICGLFAITAVLTLTAKPSLAQNPTANPTIVVTGVFPSGGGFADGSVDVGATGHMDADNYAYSVLLRYTVYNKTTGNQDGMSETARTYAPANTGIDISHTWSHQLGPGTYTGVFVVIAQPRDPSQVSTTHIGDNDGNTVEFTTVHYD